MKTPWTGKEERDLLEMFYDGLDAQEIAEQLLRSYGSVARKIFALRSSGRLVGFTPKIRVAIISDILDEYNTVEFDEVRLHIKFSFTSNSFKRIKKALTVE